MPEVMHKDRPNAIEHSEMLSAEKLLSHQIITIYHGNKKEDLIPEFGLGSSDNDYGKGFYTTPGIELAKEWAWGTYTSGNKGYVHTFELYTDGLNILNLTELDSIHWIAELVYNRKLNIQDKEVVQDNIKILLEKYKLDTSEHDVIIGYRANDSYFAYAEAFVSGTIYKDTLEKALRTGELGIQVFIKSAKAFQNLKKTAVEEVPEKYRGYFVKRDKKDFICYDEFWLNKDMENMGYFFEYCDKYCKEILEDNTFILDKERFIEAFMKSDCRALMEIGHPTLLSQAAYDTVKNFIQVDNNNDIEAFRLKGGQPEYKHMQLYWTGWMYAYIHFRSRVCSKTIIEKLPLKEMLIDYKAGHEMSKETYYKKIAYLFKS